MRNKRASSTKRRVKDQEKNQNLLESDFEFKKTNVLDTDK